MSTKKEASIVRSSGAEYLADTEDDGYLYDVSVSAINRFTLCF